LSHDSLRLGSYIYRVFSFQPRSGHAVWPGEARTEVVVGEGHRACGLGCVETEVLRPFRTPGKIRPHYRPYKPRSQGTLYRDVPRKATIEMFEASWLGSLALQRQALIVDRRPIPQR